MSCLRRRFSCAKIVVTGALFLALSGGVAIAVTAIPATDGTIHGCYANATGQLRVVANADDCRANETALPWNQQGAKGDKGDPGQQGPKGDPADSDGGAVVFGRVLTNGTRCLLGPPSGIAVAAEGECTPAGATAAQPMPLPAAKVARSLRATIAEAQTDQTTVWLVTPNAVVLSCTIPAGATSCARTEPGPVVPAGTPLATIVTYSNDPGASAPSVSFGYELTNP